MRYRGIYEAALYEGKLTFEGEFNRPDMRPFAAESENILWQDAFVTLGVTDLKGVHDTVRLAWNGESYASTPGVRSGELVPSGMTFTPPVAAGGSALKFSLTLNLGGSTDILFVPAGETTDVVLESPWSDPSFIGGFLPVSREIADDHFKAEWKVLSLNRNFPQSWTGEQYRLSESSFGARLFLPVDQYQKTSRTVKYAFLFIVLTFASLFLSEMMTRTILHPIQYSLIGFALVLFYLMLLSFSEHMKFDGAFAVSSISTIALVSLYTNWIAAKRIAAVTAMVLTALYIFLYITLQLQDYALLVGTLGLTVTLAVIMYVTRRVDWFALNALARDH
jgi:inner membrane protein